MQILVIDLADTHTNSPGSESYRLNENTAGSLHTHSDWHTGVFLVDGGQVCVLHKLLWYRRMGRAESNSNRDILNFFFLAVEELLRCSSAFRRTLFSTASDWAPILQSAVLSPPFPSLSVFLRICFWYAVHLSLWRSNWASCVAWPTAEAHCWHPFNPAAFKHLWYHWRKAAVCRNQPRWVKLQMECCFHGLCHQWRFMPKSTETKTRFLTVQLNICICLQRREPSRWKC